MSFLYRFITTDMALGILEAIASKTSNQLDDHAVALIKGILRHDHELVKRSLKSLIDQWNQDSH